VTEVNFCTSQQLLLLPGYSNIAETVLQAQNGRKNVPPGEPYISDVNLGSSSHFQLAQSGSTDHQRFRTNFQIVLPSLFRAETKKE